MLVQLREGLVPVILPRDVCAEAGKVLQLLLDVLGGGLDVRLDPTQVFLVVHFCSGIADDLDVVGQEAIAVLREWISWASSVDADARQQEGQPTRPKRAGYYKTSVNGRGISSGAGWTYGLFLRQVTGSTQNNNHRVVLELNGAADSFWSAPNPLPGHLSSLESPIRDTIRPSRGARGCEAGEGGVVCDIKVMEGRL